MTQGSRQGLTWISLVTRAQWVGFSFQYLAGLGRLSKTNWVVHHFCLRIFHTLSVITRLDDDTPSFQIVNADDSPDLLSRPKDRVPSLVTIPSRVVRHGSMNHRQLDCPITNQQTWTRYLMIPILYKGSEFFEGHLELGLARMISAYMRWNE